MNTVGLINKLFFGTKAMGAKAGGEKAAPFTPAEREALSRALGSVLERQRANAARMPGLDGMKERLRRVRDFSVGNTELLDEAVENLRGNNVRVLVADGLDAAFEMLVTEIGPEKTVVKSKSNVTKEMRLTARCAERGVNVVETDIGDRILQLARGRPSHPTGPVSHMSRAEIAGVLSRELGRDVPPDAERLIAVLREEIVSAIRDCRVGITGANAVAAREGSVLIIHNEGNVTELARLPGKHIIVTDSTKIYPTLEDALNMVKLQTYSATGAVTTSYMNVISGVSKTADIEKKLFYGIHGPSEVVLIIVKRRELPVELRESAFCIGCGGCLPECPVYSELGSSFGAYYRQGGIGVVQSALEEGLATGFSNGLYSCMKCGACTVNCPVSIDTPKLIARLREDAVEEPVLKKRVRPFRMLAASVVLAANAKGAVRRFSRSGSGLAYFPGCIPTVNLPGMRADIKKLMEAATGAQVRVLEGCCGGAWDTFGFKKECGETFERFVGAFALNPPERIVVSCPHCYEVLWIRNRERLEAAGVREVLRLTEIIKETVLPAEVEGGERRKVAFHDACLFGRRMGIYDEPREVLSMCAGTELVEMERSRSNTLCCGFPLMVQAPEAAASMAQKVADAAITAGADVLVTSGCPGCHYALKRAEGIDVEDISGFIYSKYKTGCKT
ncbi:MAG: LUD domain-containing protein [Thermodesulfobacteriota bacterium]